jgi:hypothetical protein
MPRQAKAPQAKPAKPKAAKGIQNRTPEERETDLRRITDLYLQGKTQQEISLALGISRQQVSYDLGKVRRRWAEDTALNLDEIKLQQLDRIDALEREAWAAWFRSIPSNEPAEFEQGDQFRPRRKGDPDLGRAAEVLTFGDTKYLAQVQWCITERSKILGLYAPVKNELSGSGGGPVKIEQRPAPDLSRLGTAELLTLRGIVGKAAGNDDTAVNP